MRRLALVLVLVLVVIGLVLARDAARANSRDADAAFRAAVRAFEEGRYQDSERELRTALATGTERARDWRDEAGYHFWVRVLAHGGELAGVARQLLALAETGPSEDDEVIARLTSWLSPRRSDAVKIAAARALASLGPRCREACTAPLTSLAADPTAAIEVREAACETLGQVLQSREPPQVTVAVLVELFHEGDERLYRAAGLALGRMKLTAEQARTVFDKR